MKKEIVWLSSDVCPIMNVWTYWTLLWDTVDDLVEYEADWSELEFNADEYWDKYDHSKFKKWIAECYKPLITDELKKIWVDVVRVDDSISSPSYYNFSNDWINFDVKVDLKKLVKTIEKLNKDNDREFEKWIDSEFTSYDWFMSHTENRLDPFLYNVLEWKCQEVWAWLFYVRCKKFEWGLYAPLDNYIQTELYEAVNDCTIYDFIS